MEVLMSPTRPNPTQTRTLDAATLRREMKLLLTTDYILDAQEWDELIDQSNTGHRLAALRVRVLRGRRDGGHGPRLLSDQERIALGLFILGEGPRPRFARFVSPDGHFGSSYLAPDDPDAPAPAPPWPAQVGGEPGRYVKATGQYAGPGDGQ
jgi:hypothetical protein